MHELKYALTIGGQDAIFENEKIWKKLSKEEIDKIFEEFEKEAEKEWKEKYQELGQTEPIIGRKTIEKVLKKYK